MLGRIKNKFPCHRRRKAAQTTATESKPQNGSTSPVTRPEKQEYSANPIEKPQAAQPEPPAQAETPQEADAPTESTGPTRDLWHDAFKQLPVAKQQKLRTMGFDRLSSGSVESDISELVSEVNKKQEECEKKFWRVPVGGEEIVLRNYTTKIVGWLEKAGDIAVQFAPPQASIPWQVLKSVMQIPVIEGEQMAALLGTTEKIVQIISRGQVYEQVYLPNTPGTPEDALSRNLQSCLLGIYSTSLDLLAESENLFSQNTARRTISAIVNPGKASGGLADLAEQEEELIRDVTACESRRSADADNRMIGMLDALNAPMTRMDEGISHLVQHMDEKRRIEMLEWISPIPFGKHHHNVKDKRTPGTGQWLLHHKDFCNWERKTGSALFVLQGTAGTGKTYLTSTVIDYLETFLTNPPKDEGFAFFYCDKNEPSRAQAQSILQSYVRQLSTTASNPESPQIKLQETYSENREKGSTFTLDQCKKQILASLGIYQKTTLVVDAMDECSPESRDELIEALKEFVAQSKKPVKIFISSRPDPDIQRQLEDAPGLSVDASDNQEDIRSYLQGQIDKFAKKAAFFGRLKADIVTRLLQRSQGMFQWAALQVHQIERCRTESSVWKRLENLPEDLHKAYDEVFTEIESLEEPDRTLSKRALLWVMCATTPLTSRQLLSAIRIKVDSAEDMPDLEDELDEAALLSLCNNFLVMDTQLKVWRFPHLSVREFLETKPDLTVPHAHCQAAAVSLVLLNNVKKEEDEDDEPASVDASYRTVEQIDISDFVHPLQKYARQSWAIHLPGAKQLERDLLAALLKKFLGSAMESSPQYKVWLSGFDDDRAGWRDSLSGWVNTELEPNSTSLFAMCLFSLDSILSDWWESAAIDISLANDNQHNLLAVAAIGGSSYICKTLINRGVPVNARFEGPVYGTPLVAAAHQGQTEIVELLLESGADINTVLSDSEGLFGNALSAAICSNNLDTVKYLLKAGAEVNVTFLRESYDQNEKLGSPLGRAASRPNTEILQCLMQAGADVNAPLKSHDYGSPLAVAARMGHLGNVKCLVEKGKADVNMHLQSGPWGSALEAAASSGELEIVKYLVERAGANVNMQLTSPRSDGSALAGAVDGWIEGRPEIVRYLVEEAGADVNLPLVTGSYGSVLAKAVSSGTAEGQLDLARYLLEAEADVNMLLQHGESGSALASAAGSGFDVEAVEFLLKAGADVNKPLPTGNFGNALIAAASGDNLDIVRCMVEAGADVNLSGLVGNYGSALAAAAAGSNLEMVEYLLEAGADVNLPLLSGKFGSALAAAAIGYDVEIVDLLLERGAEVNQSLPTGDYGSALAAAVSTGNADIVKSLVKAGAEVNIPLPEEMRTELDH
ncbi:uncharacterized protein N7482_001309 [Penicillium canariense]|uniref:NACHT domain-containing protein n=1 Tax=Penicillium canariense TaxID=189055 RepID=A0A9W9IFD7_9EURO|nr:uncharacterized protein N7482_001309 [Penicillium canariense]KAJ5175432.1 hypothetical protein N7482_001309 [Penicillium canariense]